MIPAGYFIFPTYKMNFTASVPDYKELLQELGLSQTPPSPRLSMKKAIQDKWVCQLGSDDEFFYVTEAKSMKNSMMYDIFWTDGNESVKVGSLKLVIPVKKTGKCSIKSSIMPNTGFIESEVESYIESIKEKFFTILNSYTEVQVRTLIPDLMETYNGILLSKNSGYYYVKEGVDTSILERFIKGTGGDFFKIPVEMSDGLTELIENKIEKVTQDSIEYIKDRIKRYSSEGVGPAGKIRLQERMDLTLRRYNTYLTNTPTDAILNSLKSTVDDLEITKREGRSNGRQ